MFKRYTVENGKYGAYFKDNSLNVNLTLIDVVKKLNTFEKITNFKAITDSKFFMIKEHPTLDLIKVQVDNIAIQLNKERQDRVYECIKHRINAKRD